MRVLWSLFVVALLLAFPVHAHADVPSAALKPVVASGIQTFTGFVCRVDPGNATAGPNATLTLIVSTEKGCQGPTRIFGFCGTSTTNASFCSSTRYDAQALSNLLHVATEALVHQLTVYLNYDPAGSDLGISLQIFGYQN
jgi:hypothetical protein